MVEMLMDGKGKSFSNVRLGAGPAGGRRKQPGTETRFFNQSEESEAGSHGALCVSESICLILQLTRGHMFKEAQRLILISRRMSAGQRLVSNCTLQQPKSLCVMVC